MVICAALLHAVWNSLVKIQADRLTTMALITLGSSIVCFAMLPFVALPSLEVIPYIAISLLLHNAYYFTLIFAYSYGDFGYVYPLMRGAIPLIVTFISISILNEVLTLSQYMGIALIVFGIFCLLFLSGRRAPSDAKAAFFAMAAALLVASYTIVDGLGARLNGDAHSYAFWIFALDGIPLTAIAVIQRRRDFFSAVQVNARIGLLAGVASVISTWLIIWSLTMSPMALVSALRETSIVFSILISFFILKERTAKSQIVTVILMMLGVMLLR